MPYSLQQYVPASPQNGEVYNSSSSSSKPIIPTSAGAHLTFLPTHVPHHVPLSFAPQHHRHHHYQHQHLHHPPPSPPTSVTSSYSSSSSLSSPTLPSTSSSLSRTISPQQPPTCYSPPPRMVPFGYSTTSAEDGGRMLVRPEVEDSEVYPLDLSVRSAPREDSDSGQHYPQHRSVVARQRHQSRHAGNEPRYKHHACLTKNCGCGNCSNSNSSRAQQRLSPYSVPMVLSGGHAHSPSSSSRSPVPQRTDSPVYGRRRTPSPAYYSGLLPDGSFRAGSVPNGVTGHPHHHHQPCYLPAGLPPPPPPPPSSHLAPSPSLAVHPEHSSSPSSFQILTTADTVLHGAPTVSGLFKPYQDQVGADVSTSVSSVSIAERQVEENSHHQNRDPRHQLLRQLQLSQQRQQQQGEEEEERTYVDLDSPSQPARSAPLKQAEDRAPRGQVEMRYGQTNGSDTPMEVGAHSSDNRLPVFGYGEDEARAELEKRDGPRPTGPFYLKSELSQKNSNTEESHHYLRQAFLSSDLQQQRDMAEADNLSQHHLKQQREQQHPQQQMTNHQEQIMPEEEEARHTNQHHHYHQQHRLETATSHPAVPMAVCTTTETNDCKGIDSKKGRVNPEKVPQEVLEEAKLLAFLSKTTLVTLKPNGQLNKNLGNDDSGSDSNGEAPAGSEGTSTWDHGQKGTSRRSAHNIFKDFHVVSNDESSGKLPKIDFCLSSSARAGPPSSCKGSLVAPKKICFRLVDLVGLLVEQSLRA